MLPLFKASGSIILKEFEIRMMEKQKMKQVLFTPQGDTLPSLSTKYMKNTYIGSKSFQSPPQARPSCCLAQKHLGRKARIPSTQLILLGSCEVNLNWTVLYETTRLIICLRDRWETERRKMFPFLFRKANINLVKLMCPDDSQTVSSGKQEPSSPTCCCHTRWAADQPTAARRLKTESGGFVTPLSPFLPLVLHLHPPQPP